MSAPTSQQDRTSPPPYGRFAMGPVRGDRLPPLPYAVVRDVPGALEFVTAPARRRGQARLHAAGAVVPAVAVGFLVLLAAVVSGRPDLVSPELVGSLGVVAVALAVLGFASGRRMRIAVRADGSGLEHVHVPAVGRARVTRWPREEIAAFEIHGLLRTLGADLELMVITNDGAAHALGQGDPHTGQLRALGEKLAAVYGVELRLGDPR